MEVNEKVYAVLNSFLADEINLINQHLIQSELCAKWNYAKLSKAIRKQALDEIHQVEWLIDRIVYFAGITSRAKSGEMEQEITLTEIIKRENEDELNAFREFVKTIKQSRAFEEQEPLDLMPKINNIEEGHVNWTKIQRGQIEQIGIDNYLVNQIKSSSN